MESDFSAEELLAAGLRISDAQIDYYLHPERHEFAVIVFGVPDPDRLYITGPDEYATMYQIAAPDEPCNQRGMRACVLPAVICQAEPEDAIREIREWYGEVRDVDMVYPFVTGHIEDGEWTHPWLGEEIPVMAAIWDLWPIPPEDVYSWATATRLAFEHSKMWDAFYLADLKNDGEIHTEKIDDLIELAEMYVISEPEKAAAIQEEIDALKAEHLAGLHQSLLHPEHGVEDPQIPPIQLDPEQNALWTSLQRLSQSNWATLSRWHGGDVDHNGRTFVEANRRICPWY